MGWLAKRRVVVGLGLAVVAVICAGCARAVVRDVQGDRSLILPRPARVVVFDFTTGPTDVQVLSSPHQEGERVLYLSQEQPDLLATAVADSLAARLVEDIRSLGLTAERVAGAALPEVRNRCIDVVRRLPFYGNGSTETPGSRPYPFQNASIAFRSAGPSKATKRNRAT